MGTGENVQHVHFLLWRLLQVGHSLFFSIWRASSSFGVNILFIFKQVSFLYDGTALYCYIHLKHGWTWTQHVQTFSLWNVLLSLRGLNEIGAQGHHSRAQTHGHWNSTSNFRDSFATTNFTLLFFSYPRRAETEHNGGLRARSEYLQCLLHPQQKITQSQVHSCNTFCFLQTQSSVNKKSSIDTDLIYFQLKKHSDFWIIIQFRAKNMKTTFELIMHKMP